MSPDETNTTSRSGSTTELEFRIREKEYFPVGESRKLDCDIRIDECVPRSDGTLLMFLTARGEFSDRDLDQIIRRLAAVDAWIVRESENGALFALIVEPPNIVGTVGDSRAVPRTIMTTDGEVRVVITVPPRTEPQRVIELFLTRFPESKLYARRQRTDGPMFSQEALQQSVLDQLTEKQYDALVTAQAEGYFEWPRTTTAAACAEALDISQSTFSQHFWVGLRKVVDRLLEESSKDYNEN